MNPQISPREDSCCTSSVDCKRGDRCCFHPKGRCVNGYSCQHCHFDHEKRKRKGKKRTERALELGSDIGSMPPSMPPTPHEAFHMMLPEYAAHPPPPFHDPGMEMPLAPWYPPELPNPMVYPPPGMSPDPCILHEDSRDEYILKLEEENRYLRSMLLQHMGPGAALPPSVVHPRAQVASAPPVEGPPGLSHVPVAELQNTQTSLLLASVYGCVLFDALVNPARCAVPKRCQIFFQNRTFLDS